MIYYNNILSRLRIINLENIIIWLFSILFVFISQDPNLEYQHPLTVILSKLFMGNFVGSISIFELVVFVLTLYLFFTNKHSFYSNKFKKERVIYFLTILYIVFLMINPNNSTLNPIFGLPILSDPGIFIYLFFMYTIFFIKDEEKYLIVFDKIISSMLIVSVFRIILLLLKWILGLGIFFLNVSSTSMEEDTLIISVLFSLLFLNKYYMKKKIIYLIIWILYFLFELFSFRRSGFMLISLGSIIYLISAYVKNKISKYALSIFAVFIIILISTNISILPESVNLYLNRYFGKFIELPNYYQYEQLSKNLHIEQSNESILIYARELPFWGTGYGQTQDKIKFNYMGNTGIHNAYFNLWEQQGLFALIYYIIIILYIINEAYFTLKMRKLTDKNIINTRYSVLIFMLLYIINSYVLMMINVTGLKMRIMFVMILSFLFRFDEWRRYLLGKKYIK